MRKPTMVIALCALSFLLGALPPVLASSVTFTFTPFNVPFTGSVGTGGVGINDIGQIVGEYDVFDPTINDFVGHGFLRDAEGNYSKIDFPEAQDTNAKEINNQGQIVGRFFKPGTGVHGYLLSSGIFSQIDVPFPNGIKTKARGINDAGMIVGTYIDTTTTPLSGSHERGFLRDADGNFSTIDFPGVTFTHASKINDPGQIVGAYLDSSLHAHGFLLSGGTFSTIDVPFASETILTGINNSGKIVGVYTDATNTIHSFLDMGGSFMEIVLPGGLRNTGGALLIDFYVQVGQPGVESINDRSQITGSFMAGDGSIHGFIGTPTVQP